MRALHHRAEQDYEKALHWYLIAAEKGDVQSQVNAANAYYLGQGTTENHAKAHEWWLKAAQRGHLQSQKNVGANYWNGDGVEKDDMIPPSPASQTGMPKTRSRM